jgi:hypothetical protein
LQFGYPVPLEGVGADHQEAVSPAPIQQPAECFDRNEGLRRPAVPDGHGERVLAEGALQAPGHRPADDLHGGEVLHRAEVEPALSFGNVRDVGSHTASGTWTSKLRSSRFSATACACRLSVVIGTRRLPRGGRMPFSFMSLATVRFETPRPRPCSSAWILGAP